MGRRGVPSTTLASSLGGWLLKLSEHISLLYNIDTGTLLQCEEEEKGELYMYVCASEVSHKLIGGFK